MIVFGSKEGIMKYLLLLFSNYTRKPENEQNLQPGKRIEDPACSMEDKKKKKKKEYTMLFSRMYCNCFFFIFASVECVLH